MVVLRGAALPWSEVFDDRTICAGQANGQIRMRKDMFSRLLCFGFEHVDDSIRRKQTRGASKLERHDILHQLHNLP
jgi:hypothetical protein